MLERSGFLTIYISLMSIILTIVVAVFARSQIPEVQVSEDKSHRVDSNQIEVIQYSDLFINQNINTEKAAPLAEILKNHDLSLDVDIYVAIGGQDGTAIARATDLTRYLLEQGVPDQSLKIKANLQQQSPEVEVRFVNSDISVEGDQHGSIW